MGQHKLLKKTELASRVGMSVRTVTRLYQQGLLTPVDSRHGLGRGRGTTPLEFSSETEVPKLEDWKILRREVKDGIERQTLLWLKHGDIRIAPNLADALDRLMHPLASSVKTLDDVDTLTACFCKPADIPRSNAARIIFKDLNPKEMHAVMTMVLCIVLGIRLPQFDNQPNLYALQVFKRVFELSEEWRMPPDLFDIFPHAHEQIIHCLRTATPSELKTARRVCRSLSRFLSRVLGEEKFPRWEAVAAAVGLIIFAIRWYKPTITKADAVILYRSVYRAFKLAVSGPSPAGNANACR